MTLPSHLIPIFGEIAKNEGFTDYNLEITSGSNEGDGMVAEILSVTIKGSKKELNLIVKLPPTEGRFYDVMELFERENFFYKEIVPAFENFQKEREIQFADGFFSYPKCFYASVEREINQAAIIMEDIRKNGFLMGNKSKPVDFSHCRILMIQLGRLHAISFAMREQQPELFNRLKNIPDLLSKVMMHDVMKPINLINCEKASKLFNSDEEFKNEKFVKFSENLWSKVSKCLEPEIAGKYAVIGHGDCWINNMMFSYIEDLHKSPEEIRLFDWQNTRYASPALDVCNFLFVCTNKRLRGYHYEQLIQIYHKSLSSHLERLGGDAKIEFPLNVLYEQLKKVGKAGVALSLMAIPLMVSDPADLLKFGELETSKDKNAIEELKAEQIEVKYRERMSGIICDSISYGYL